LLFAACASLSPDEQLAQGFEKDTIKANAGNPAAAFDVGIVYYLGYARGRTPDGFIHFKSMAQNNALAYKYLKISADNGNAEAAALVGSLLMSGNGAPKNEKEAVKYFEQSKDRFIESRYSLSQYYLNSADPSTQKKGYELVSNAEKSDNPEMMKTLALYYTKGVFIKRDSIKAAELNKAAETIRQKNIEILKVRMASIEDSQARQKKYGQVIDEESDRLQMQNALLLVFGIAGYKIINNIQTSSRGNAPSSGGRTAPNTAGSVNSKPFLHNSPITIPQLVGAGVI
jgi:TPR repeat protein